MRRGQEGATQAERFQEREPRFTPKQRPIDEQAVHVPGHRLVRGCSLQWPLGETMFGQSPSDHLDVLGRRGDEAPWISTFVPDDIRYHWDRLSVPRERRSGLLLIAARRALL